MVPATADAPLPEPVITIAIALADEGVPVAAIARSIKQPSEDVRLAIREAIDAGRIVEMPRDDWPPHLRRAERLPSNGQVHTDEQLAVYCRRMFSLTQLEATVLVPLLKRDEASKSSLHSAIQAGRSARCHASVEETDPKMVDVVICKMRKKLRGHSIEIKTLWAKGYFIERATRRLVFEMLAAYLSGHPLKPETENGEGPEVLREGNSGRVGQCVDAEDGTVATSRGPAIAD